MSKNTKNNIKVEKKVDQNKAQHRRSNYYKYEGVKEVLRTCLEKNMTIAQAAKAAGISTMTAHKYKSMLSHETGIQYMSKDEQVYLEIRKRSRGDSDEK